MEVPHVAPPPVAQLNDEQGLAEVERALAARRNQRFNAVFVKKGKGKRRDEEDNNSDYASATNLLQEPAVPVRVEGPVFSLADSSSEVKHALYRFMYLFENQRGRTWLGFRFSDRALKSGYHFDDPAHFTRIEDNREIDLPYSRLEEVQPPSSDWVWHGSEWLIDMVGDGMTSYDGFQYNKKFKSAGWAPTVPGHYFLSCVRRRRWLRLMVYLPSLTTSYPAGVNPAKHIPTSSEATPNETPILTPQPNSPSTLPTLPSSTIERNPEELKHIWRGDDRDWARCHGALRSLGRDGRKLELWKHWIDPNGKPATRRQVMWTGETSNLLNGGGTAQVYELIADAPFEVDITRAPVEFIRPVLEAHAKDIVSLFMFPDSRARFMDMLKDAGLLDCIPASASLGDFWSRHKASGGSPLLHPTS